MITQRIKSFFSVVLKTFVENISIQSNDCRYLQLLYGNVALFLEVFIHSLKHRNTKFSQQ